jgi:hypothetical protein
MRISVGKSSEPTTRNQSPRPYRTVRSGRQSLVFSDHRITTESLPYDPVKYCSAVRASPLFHRASRKLSGGGEQITRETKLRANYYLITVSKTHLTKK